MVSPNWPSEDEPDYTPQFADGGADIQLNDPPERDLEELRPELETLVEVD